MSLTFYPALVPSAFAASAGWPSFGNGIANDGAAVGETALSPSTVPGLVPLWTLETTGEVSATPTVEGTAVYITDSGGSVYRVDATTGKPVWHVMLPKMTGLAASVSRNSPAIGPSTVIVGDQAAGRLYALDKGNGALVWRADLDTARHALVTSSPVVVGNQIVVGVSSLQEESAAAIRGFVPTFRGSVVSLDVNSGKILWKTYTVPEGFTGGGVWGSNLAVDTTRNAVYAGTGDNYSVPASVAACQAAAPNDGALSACLPAADHIDSVMSLNLSTGAINWAQRAQALDTWTVSCLQSARPPATPCPEPHGLDYDFGSAPNLFTATINGTSQDVVGAGEKSGVYWAFNRDTGAILWGTQVNPGGTRGGIEWGSATDGTRIYVAASNSNYVYTGLVGSTAITDGGFWSALDPATGQVIWQSRTTERQPKPAAADSRTLPPPAGALARTEGAVTVANGVLYGANDAGTFEALDASSGKVLWSYKAGGAAIDGPSIVNGVLYWGDGYGNIGPTAKKLIAFGLKK